MDKKHDYGSILNVMIEVAKERGMQNSGSDYALACYQLLETAISEAEVWGVPLADIGSSRPISSPSVIWQEGEVVIFLFKIICGSRYRD